jgi:hypothetical protein
MTESSQLHSLAITSYSQSDFLALPLTKQEYIQIQFFPLDFKIMRQLR